MKKPKFKTIPVWLQNLHVYLATQLCLTLWDPLDYNPPDFSVHGILQARILEWAAISFSRASSWPRDQTQASWLEVES